MRLFYYLTITVCAFAACSPTQNKTESITSPEVFNEEIKIDYNVYGEGSLTIVLIHGWCINQTYWDSQVDALKSEYKVVTMDMPGFGQSGTSRTNWTIEKYGEDVNALIDQLELSNVVLVGHSMGGNVVVESATGNDKVIAVIGIDNFKDVGTELTPEVQQQVDEFLIILNENFSEIAPAYAEGSLFHSNTDSLVRKRVMDDFATSNPQSAMGSLEALLAYGSKEQEELAVLKQPLYLINSNASPTSRDGLDQTGVDYEVLEIDSTGHYPMLEKPEVFNQLLNEAINRVKEKRNPQYD